MSDSTADEIRAAQAARREAKRAAESTQRPESAGDKISLTGQSMDTEVYGESKGSRFANFDTSIAAGPADADDDMDDDGNAKSVRLLDSCELQNPCLLSLTLWTARLISWTYSHRSQAPTE